MRAAAFLVLFSGVLFAADMAKPVTNEKLDFEIKPPPDSIDWTTRSLDPKGDVQAYFYTEFADTSPLATATVQLLVVPLSAQNAHRELDKIAEDWSKSLLSWLEDQHDRKDGPTKLGGQDAYQVSVTGNYESGIHTRSYILTRMGTHLYMLLVDRCYMAASDEDVSTQIQQIRDSFRFLKKADVSASKNAKGSTPPGPATGPGGAGAPGKAGANGKNAKKGPQEDPKKLAPKKLRNAFWRYTALKPQGLVETEPSENDIRNGIRLKLHGTTDGGQLYLRLYVETEAAENKEIRKIAKTFAKRFEETRRDTRAPKITDRIDPRYLHLHRMSKEELTMTMIGRRTTVEYLTFLVVNCRNQRQYRFEILYIGPAAKKHFEEVVDKFLISFTPTK